MDLTAEISRVLPAPLPLTRQLAGLLAFRLRAELLVVAVPRMRPEPIPTVTTLSLSLRAHRRLPKENREEYDNHGLLPNRFTQIDATAADRPREQKKEEDDPFGSREEKKNTNLSDRLKKNHFKPAFTEAAQCQRWPYQFGLRHPSLIPFMYPASHASLAPSDGTGASRPDGSHPFSALSQL